MGGCQGASGKVPAAIHMSPEAHAGGMIGRLRDGDIIWLDAAAGRLETEADLAARPPGNLPLPPQTGYGRELFSAMRGASLPAEQGAGSIYWEAEMKIAQITALGPVMPVIVIHQAEQALGLADALLEGDSRD